MLFGRQPNAAVHGLAAAGWLGLALILTTGLVCCGELVFRACIVLLLLGIAVSDLMVQRIPNRLVLAVSILALSAAWRFHRLETSLAGGLFALVLFVVIAAVSKQMGAGDVKLAASIGLVAGWPGVLVTLWWGMLSGAVLTAILIGCQMVQRNDRIAYGPYLCLGVGFYWITPLLLRSFR